jgi:hypothetical protein
MRLGQRFESARRLSFFPLDKPNSREGEALGEEPRASLHHPYITEAWTKSVQKFMARNVSRNVREKVVL